MPKETTSLMIDDISDFAKSLRAALKSQDDVPSHATLLGMIAKAGGYANYQHLRAAPRIETPAPKQSKQLMRALRAFKDGIMIRWPKQTAVQALCMWVFWAALPDDIDLTEAQVNAVLMAHHSFGDHALLRRSLIDHKLVQRTADGRIYRKITSLTPPPDAAAVLAAQRPS